MALHAVISPWFARIMFTIGHLCIPLALYELYKLGLSLPLLKVALIGITYDLIGGLGITAGAHRLWAHRTYTANYLFRFILMCFNSITFQGEIYYWARDHRVHHKYSDTPADPHNVTRGFTFSHIGWLFLPRAPECTKALEEIDMKDLDEDSVVQFQLHYYPILVLLFRFIIPTYTGFYITGSWRVGFFFNSFLMWCQSLHHTFLVNSAAHMWGFRPYDPKILPAENKAVVVLALGEGHHNFHHRFPQDYATSELSWNKTFNPSKAFIDLGAVLGMVTKRQRVQYNESKKRYITTFQKQKNFE